MERPIRHPGRQPATRVRKEQGLKAAQGPKMSGTLRSPCRSMPLEGSLYKALRPYRRPEMSAIRTGRHGQSVHQWVQGPIQALVKETGPGTRARMSATLRSLFPRLQAGKGRECPWRDQTRAATGPSKEPGPCTGPAGLVVRNVSYQGKALRA